MKAPRRIGSLETAALLGTAFVVLASACGQSSSSAQAPVQSAGSSPPPGGPVPTQLLGDWFLPPATVSTIMGNDSCRLLKLTLTVTSYHLTHTDNPACGTSSAGDVVVNKTEMDFFNADVCGLKLPDGVGRYQWAFTGGVLHFTPLNQDPCPRGQYWLANRNYTRSG